MLESTRETGGTTIRRTRRAHTAGPFSTGGDGILTRSSQGKRKDRDYGGAGTEEAKAAAMALREAPGDERNGGSPDASLRDRGSARVGVLHGNTEKVVGDSGACGCWRCRR